jgi:Zn-dependent protease
MFDITPEVIVTAFIWYVAFLFSTTCHEASHALAAKLQGDETAARGGQVTLNPWPHIQREPYGMVLVPILSVLISGGTSLFGWASAPFNREWEWKFPKKSALMAMAGPAANFTLMFLAALGFQLVRRAGLFANPNWGPFLFQVLTIFFSLNLLLGLFNLVPAPPLDGSSAIMIFMSDSTARRYLDWLRGGSFGMVGLLIAIVIFRYVYQPIQELAAQTLLAPRFF